jgi:hypothetical protein
MAAGGALLALALVALRRGRAHQDEVFQFLEPAHQLVHGYGVLAWEWTRGLRNWAVPGLLGGVMWLARAVGLEHPWAVSGAVWAVCAAVQAWGTWALYRMVSERDGRGPALLAAALFATWGGWAAYAARPLGDSLSVPPLLGALLFVQRARAGGQARAGATGGALLGLAFLVRYPSAVFGVPLAASLVAARRWRALAGLAAGAGAVLLALGALDAATWGAWWHSAREYLGFNLLEGGAARDFGARPLWWYAPTLAATVPLMLLWHFGQGLRRCDVLVGAFAVYLGVLCALSHKEGRFLLPLVPLWIAIAAGPAWRTLTTRLTTPRARLALGAAWGLASLLGATVQLPVRLRHEEVDFMVVAGRDPGLTGLLVFGATPTDGGGQFHLRRPEVALEFEGKRREGDDLWGYRHQPLFSHVLMPTRDARTGELPAAGFCVLREGRNAHLWRRCAAPPATPPPPRPPPPDRE